ncbi:LVIVD repeat-containing protein [Nonomuraea sp. NPDC050556]|uniref:LVIVD repeat-containing protein n=1 Tax=Nonomuraea sp. NPDC050556 TaxID=3364369 RepID=UPI0037BCA59C
MASSLGRVLALAGAALVLLAPATPAGAADGVQTSPNVKHVANVPKKAPFADTEAYDTDLAFQGDYAYQGNYEGLTIYDIRNPAKPTVVSRVACPGAQNDVSVKGNLLFLSVDESRTSDSCRSDAGSTTDKSSWEGIRIFDITDKSRPKYIKAVETACGSHTHTLVPDKRGKSVYLYVSSYMPGDIFPECKPPHDKISIVKVPLDKPKAAKVVSTPVLFPEGGNETQNGLLAPTSGCHDITVFPKKNLAAGACMGDGILMDISDREHPKVTARVTDDNFAFWHSATFNNAGTKVVFTDELGGGGSATCNKTVGPHRGADAIYDIEAGELVQKGYFKIPRAQTNAENCVAHNGSLIPVKGRDIMVQSWYQGGVSIWDFTDSTKAKEIGFFDRGPLKPRDLGGSWSAYYYNGYIYSSDIQKGLDVLKISDSRTDPAAKVRLKVLNTQTQYAY